MKTIIIDGKERKIKGTLKGIKKTIRKFKDYTNISTWHDQRITAFMYELVWNFLTRPKPWIFKRRFMANVDVEEIRECTDTLLSIFYGVDTVEGKEQKNGKAGK